MTISMLPPDSGTPPLDDQFDASGVDVSLIDWMLSLSPAERLAALQQFVNAVMAVRDPHATG